MAKIALIKLKESHLPNIADIHKNAFPDSLLSALGTEVIKKYYEWQMNGPHDAYCFGAMEDEELVGFVLGGVFRGSMSGFLNKQKKPLFFKLLVKPWLILRKDFALKIFDGIKIFRKSRKNNNLKFKTENKKKYKSFGILSIAVHPSKQHRGTGKKLLVHSEKYAIENGFERVHLTVEKNNELAFKFYSDLGFKIETYNKENYILLTKYIAK